MYSVIVPKNVLKDIKKLDKTIAKRVHHILVDIGENPYLGIPLKGDLLNFRKWEFQLHGIQFRIAYEIHDDRIEVEIFHIGSRENFYAELKRRI